jgi:hypothetical protein
MLERGPKPPVRLDPKVFFDVVKAGEMSLLLPFQKIVLEIFLNKFVAKLTRCVSLFPIVGTILMLTSSLIAILPRILFPLRVVKLLQRHHVPSHSVSPFKCERKIFTLHTHYNKWLFENSQFAQYRRGFPSLEDLRCN